MKIYKNYWMKICIIVTIILLTSFIIPVSTVSAQPEVIRSINPDEVEPGMEVSVEIIFTAQEDMTGVLISDKVENERWEITNLSALGASCRINPDTGAVEFLWLSINSGDELKASYTLHVPDDVSIEPYILIGALTSISPEYDVEITGEYLLMVKDNTPIISIYTDKTNYNTGDTMYLGLDIKNPDSVALTACVAVWLENPSGSIIAVPVHAHTANLPAGLDYSNPNFMVFTLPSIPSGTYTWHAAIMEPATHSVIAEDYSGWDFMSTRETTGDIRRVLEDITGNMVDSTGIGQELA